MLAYAHPITGGLVLLLLLFVGSLGLKLRGRRRDREKIAARHARLAPIAYSLVAASWLLGTASTRLFRDDLEWMTTLHFRSGTLTVLLLTGSALTARSMTRGRASLREIHPWFGAGALLLAAAQAVTGLRITP